NENPMSAVFYAELDRPSQPPQPVVLKFVDGAIDFMLSAEAAGSKALTEALDSGEMPRIARIRLPRYILGADSAIDASSAKELARLAAAAGKSPDIDFTHALVMEYLPGPSLDEVNLAPGDLAPLWEALRALGLNQNDVKAQNIKLPNGELSVFGLIDTSLMERTSAEDPEKQAWLTRYVASNKTLTLQPGASLSLRIGRRLLTITRQDANHLLVQTSGEERVMEVPESLPVEGVALWKDPAGDRCLRLTRLTPDSIRLVNLTDRELYVGSGRSRRPFSAITDFPR
ncbi:MAG: hypothetical protein KGK30_07300, partial [Elusimicrobia bacterium]|nr:hypothetical protein [Elusimicrobiota bacterium]